MNNKDVLVSAELAKEKLARICDQLARTYFQIGADNADGSGISEQTACLDCAHLIRNTDLTDCQQTEEKAKNDE